MNREDSSIFLKYITFKIVFKFTRWIPVKITRVINKIKYEIGSHKYPVEPWSYKQFIK